MREGLVTALAFLLGGAAFGLMAALTLQSRRLINVTATIVLIVALALMLSETV